MKTYNLSEFLDVYANQKQPHWFMTKQTITDIYLIFYIARVFNNYKHQNIIHDYASYYQQSFQKLGKYPNQAKSLNTHRNTKISQFFGLVNSVGQYKDCRVTEAYKIIDTYVMTEKDIIYYSLLIERQIEKIVLNRSDATRSSDQIDLFAVIFVYKIMLMLYLEIGDSKFTFIEFAVFIIRARKYSDYKQCVKLILEYRSRNLDANEEENLKKILKSDSVMDLRLHNMFKFLTCLDVIDNGKNDMVFKIRNDNRSFSHIENIINIFENGKWPNYSKAEKINFLESVNYFEKQIDYKMEVRMEKNIILYGPPGTGKTYNTMYYALSAIYDKPIEELKRDDYSKLKKDFELLKNENKIQFCTFHQSYGYEEFIEGIKPNIDNKKFLDYKIENGSFKSFCKIASGDQDNQYVFIIDEINRGNISKIFGELITLIEETKRLNAIESSSAILPYSKENFSIPDNVYIIGTMNTADRSIALLDTALRRRFSFIEMLPSPSLLEGIEIDGIRISELLSNLNEKISILYDKEHMIGHAFFMKLRETPTINILADIFLKKIMPLLEEYFYGDYEKIRLVLGDNKIFEDNYHFIKKSEFDQISKFGEIVSKDLSCKYEINRDAFYDIKSYQHI